MEDEMRTSESQVALIGALFQAKKLFPPIGKTKKVSAGKMTFAYAPLESIMDAVQPHLLACDLVLTQGADGHCVTTRLDHTSGEWREFSMPINEQHGNMQNYGIELTYRRRYSVQMMLGIVTEDDTDGNTNSAKRPKKDGELPADFSASGPKLIFDALPEDWQLYLRDQAPLIDNAFEQFGASRAIDMIIALELDNDQRAGLEYLLSSKCRSAIKRAQEAIKVPA
jgi:hypothetical protein